MTCPADPGAPQPGGKRRRPDRKRASRARVEGAYLTAHGQGVAQPWRSQGAASPGGCSQEAPSYSSLLSLLGRSAPEQGLSRVLPPCTARARVLRHCGRLPRERARGAGCQATALCCSLHAVGFGSLGSEWEEPVGRIPPSVFASRTCGNQFDPSYRTGRSTQFQEPTSPRAVVVSKAVTESPNPPRLQPWPLRVQDLSGMPPAPGN